jgi:ZIP family zinc transporter
VLEAGIWGLVAASSLLVGAVVAFTVQVSERALGLVLAFGAGTLVSAVAYELVEEAIAAARPHPFVALGFALGALTFYVGSIAVSRMDRDGEPAPGRPAPRRGRAQGHQIVLGSVLDGIPESVVLGLSLIDGGGIGVPILIAVFISNVPEALGASTDLAASGSPRHRILGMWAIVALASGAASALGYAIMRDAPPEVVGAVQAFAAGAIIAMLAESMFPEAYQKGGREVGLATAFGFATAAALSLAT